MLVVEAVVDTHQVEQPQARVDRVEVDLEMQV
jgi:hypothetical protein